MSSPENNHPERFIGFRPQMAFVALALLASSQFTDTGGTAYASQDNTDEQGFALQVDVKDQDNQTEAQSLFDFDDKDKAMLTLFLLAFWTVQAGTAHKAMENGYWLEHKIWAYGGLTAQAVAIAYAIEEIWN